MLLILTSPDAVLLNGKPDLAVIDVLKAASGPNQVALVSNHAEPEWFQEVFKGSDVTFIQEMGRQSGEMVAENASKFGLKPFDVLVLASKDIDVQMGKNGGAVLIGERWSTSKQVTLLGIGVDDAAQLEEVISLTDGWSGEWWFSGVGENYQVRALADLSGYGKTNTQQNFAKKLTSAAKSGGSRLNALLCVIARSLLTDGIGSQPDLVWGVYPSSASSNDDLEVLSDFSHRLRTTVSRVQFAKRSEPLFIRHKASPKRSAGGGGDRTDPTDQILTIHLNPFYREKGRLDGKNVVVIDDCTTYGVSFGVAAAFLIKAGAASVTGVALGKFGSQLRYYDIEINTDPFAPVVVGGFLAQPPKNFAGSTSNASQQALQTLIP